MKRGQKRPACTKEFKERAVQLSLESDQTLAEVDPTTYLVDVLQRVATHPALEVHLLTPRLWKENFAHAPLASDLRM